MNRHTYVHICLYCSGLHKSASVSGGGVDEDCGVQNEMGSNEDSNCGCFASADN